MCCYLRLSYCAEQRVSQHGAPVLALPVLLWSTQPHCVAALEQGSDACRVKVLGCQELGNLMPSSAHVCMLFMKETTVHVGSVRAGNLDQ